MPIPPPVVWRERSLESLQGRCDSHSDHTGEKRLCPGCRGTFDLKTHSAERHHKAGGPFRVIWESNIIEEKSQMVYTLAATGKGATLQQIQDRTAGGAGA